MLQKKVTLATARVCGLGQFIFYINGEKVSDHELDPAWTNYDKCIEYVEFDVTNALVLGENVIGAEIGNGWYIKQDENYTFRLPGFMPPNPNPYHNYGSCLVFGLEIELEYEDGTREVIQSDDSFKVCKNPVLVSNVYGSERVDGSLVQKGWNTCDFDDSQWKNATIIEGIDAPKGTLICQDWPAIKVIKNYQAKELTPVNGRRIFDFGQNMSALLDIQIKGKKGNTIRIYPAEKLGADGDVDQVAKNWTTVDSCISYSIGSDDCWEEYRMKFTYFAGRYVAVESDADVEIKELKADAISSAWKKAGRFQCDDKRFEQIYDLVEKAVEANMVSVHTDCPTIERFAWQEPNHLMAPSIMYMKDGKALWNKFLRDMRIEQHTKEDVFYDYEGKVVYPGEGLMPSQCPCYIPNVLPVPGMGSFYDIIGWGSTCILGTAWHYQFYGDKQIIVDNYDAGKKYFKHLMGKRTKEGFINHGLGDWGNPTGMLARENVETAFLYADAKKLAEFAGILGLTEEQSYYESCASEICENYNRLLLMQNEDGLWCYRSYEAKDTIVMTQACEAMPLYFGMVPEDKIADVTKAFRITLEEKNAFIAGEIALPYIIQTARSCGWNDLICSFILRKEHPSYYAFVLDEETTLGEYWESNPRSHCHDMMGHIVEWYYNGLAGIQPLAPGFTKVLIKPYLPESMNELTCSYASVQGTITVAMHREDGMIKPDVNVPDEVEYSIDRSNLTSK